MFALDDAGGDKTGRAIEVRTARGGFAGIIVENYGRSVRVYFNSTATRGSARKFASVPAALEYLHDRRVKKGWAA